MKGSHETLISAEQISERVVELGAQIRADHGDEEITLIGVLKGSILFMADLARAIPGDVQLEFLGVSSYMGTKSTGQVRITHDLSADITGRNIVLVEDIVDTGLTLKFLIRTLNQRNPKSLRVVTLLDKPAHRSNQVQVDYVGFKIPDAFVIGYGLDLDQRYRNLPSIEVFTPVTD
ncbi:MAG: hypoxanthine phosphoribosyltransferase [Rhodobacterales bacterium]|nr:hypoxanthine phosphoribosyltransferase [Rhodobacterales bacterium]